MNRTAFSKLVKTEVFLNILQLRVSQVREDPDTLETQDQFVAENELSDPELCNRENKGMLVRDQMSVSPALSWNKQQEWLPMKTISGDDSSGANLTAEQLLQWSSDGQFNLEFTIHASLNINFQPRYLNGEEILSYPWSWRQSMTETDFEGPQRISEEQSQPFLWKWWTKSENTSL